ncbi:6996_t:CDS:2 [Entrophospora sp. SA101]|nr:6996_t:CDS:2 [Entrophospora sp. SA101]
MFKEFDFYVLALLLSLQEALTIKIGFTFDLSSQFWITKQTILLCGSRYSWNMYQLDY